MHADLAGYALLLGGAVAPSLVTYIPSVRAAWLGVAGTACAPGVAAGLVAPATAWAPDTCSVWPPAGALLHGLVWLVALAALVLEPRSLNGDADTRAAHVRAASANVATRARRRARGGGAAVWAYLAWQASESRGGGKIGALLLFAGSAVVLGLALVPGAPLAWRQERRRHAGVTNSGNGADRPGTSIASKTRPGGRRSGTYARHVSTRTRTTFLDPSNASSSPRTSSRVR